MSDPAQHILTWQCGKDEDKKIREALQVCCDRGKFKDLCQTASGVQFRARLKVVPPFLTELSRQHPDGCFTQEWASASRLEAGKTVYSGSERTETPNHKDVGQYADEIWRRAEQTETALQFAHKVEDNWQEYRQKMLSLPKEALIEKAGEIAAVKLTRDVLARPGLDTEVREYLDRFDNPLEVVSDSWLSEQDGDWSAAFDHVLWVLRNHEDAEIDYETEQTM